MQAKTSPAVKLSPAGHFCTGSQRCLAVIARLTLITGLLSGQKAPAEQAAGSTSSLISSVIQNENYEASHQKHYLYLSKEKSDRTNGHLWTERVVETSVGKLRMLVAEDGKPLTSDRVAMEKGRLNEVAAHPDAFRKQEQGRKGDEDHAKEMLNLLPRAFLFENERTDGAFLRVDFKPNPAYQPQSMEEKILHEAVGSLLVDRKAVRLHRLEGRLPEDVSIGFGLLATVRAGSSFSTTRGAVPGDEWKTATIDTDISGRALFFKSISKNEHAEHAGFEQVPLDLTLTQAVALLERQP
jgi:hypothetical protein